MKVRYILLFVLLGLIISSVFYFTECRQEKAKVTGFSVKVINNEYTMKNNTITIHFGYKVDIGADDFKVTEIYSDGTTKVIQQSENCDGFKFKSTIPNDEITPAGNYVVIFTHINLNKSVEIKIVVNKATLNMSGVSWDYISPFEYDGTEKEVKIAKLPAGVSVRYVGNKATNAGSYTAIAIFTHSDGNNYETIENKTLTWEILPTDLKVEGAAKLKDKYKNLIYKGSDYTIELDLTEFDANNVSATIDENTITAKNVGKYYARVDLEYIGTDTNYNRLDKTFVGVEWEIKKTPLIVKAKSHSITYGDEPSNNGVTYSGFVGEDTEAVLEGSLAFNYTYTKGDNAGTYLLTPKGLTAQNYNITFVSENLSVERVKIDFNNVDWIKDISYVYSGNEIKPVLDYQSTNIVEISYLYYKVGGGIYFPINVGNYIACVEIVLLNNNYEIINNKIVDYEYTIVPKNISVDGLVWNELDFTFNGNAIKPTISNSIENVYIEKYTYTQNGIEIEPVNVGTYVAKAELRVENDNYELSADFVELTYTINAKQVDCSSATWQGKEEYVLGEEFTKPILTNLPIEVTATYEYLKGDVAVDEIIEEGNYVAKVTLNPINSNYEIKKWPVSLRFNFEIKEAEIDNPEVEEKDVYVKLVIDGVEYVRYKDDNLKNLEYNEKINTYVGTFSIDLLLGGMESIEVDSLYVFDVDVVEDLCVEPYREIEITDGYAENFSLKLAEDNQGRQYIALSTIGYGTIMLICSE